ncbi:sigma 54-interacting transcriptional regulator [candidate division KSB1 bacterium]|nr:sigma 54-interacting transcriptional regulator [candidate division KSB1 bacterium]
MIQNDSRDVNMHESVTTASVESNEPRTASLEELLHFEKFISELSATFVNLPAPEVDGWIDHALKRVVEFMGLDRSSLIQSDGEGGGLLITHYYARPGIPALQRDMRLKSDSFPWMKQKFLKGEPLCFTSLDEFPPEAKLERDAFARFDLKSNCTMPLSIGGSTQYLLMVGSVTKERTWCADMVARLRLIGEILVNALDRKRREEELQQKLEEIHQLKEQAEAENIYLRETITTVYGPGEIVGQSPAIRHVLAQVNKVAPTDSTVLIEGETGVGKELMAQMIHKLSGRKNKIMVTVNCTTLPAALIESELFGRESGAYTGALSRQIGRFEIADGSTIFLDEIGELSPELQTKLLRVLQEGEFERLGSPKVIKVNVRVIASTNRDLADEVRRGHFRKDLYYRLRVFPIRIPTLRERREDIPMLVRVFVDEFSKKMGKTIQTLSSKSLDALQHYSWPGNIRELRNIVECAMINAGSSKLTIPLPKEREVDSLLQTLEEIESQYIRKVLEQTNGRIKGHNGAAEILGLNPSTVYFKMKKMSIPIQRESSSGK